MCVCVFVYVWGCMKTPYVRVRVMVMSVCMKRNKDRQREGREGKNKACFLLSHFQLYELQPTLHCSIELNLNPASSYSFHSPHIFTALCSLKSQSSPPLWSGSNFHQLHDQLKKSPNVELLRNIQRHKAQEGTGLLKSLIGVLLPYSKNASVSEGFFWIL